MGFYDFKVAEENARALPAEALSIALEYYFLLGVLRADCKVYVRGVFVSLILLPTAVLGLGPIGSWLDWLLLVHKVR